MKLRSLRVHGFKSFADPVDIRFHEGITAIVGPNGCGKSNIGDAIRWVLGEQRPTAIRGARMEEAIFQGTVNRRPVSRGSVSMVVSNEDGTLPVPFEEVEIGRQVFRDGGSEYSINRSACRLRDVLELCRDTGLGANAYAIIENRMIDAILSDRAEERRGLFEEAAGIGKYKDRRKGALRRLERAETDLQRLEDVIAEVHTKVRSLARQRGKAERYLQYRKRRLDVEVEVVRQELDALHERLDHLTGALEGDQRTGEGMLAELRAAEAEVEALRLREADAERLRAEAAGHLGRVREELVRWERNLAVADERALYAERRLGQIEEERAEAGNRAVRLEREAETLGRRRDAATEELERLRAEAAERKHAVEEVRGRLLEARERVEALEARERELARREAQLQGDAQAAEAQATELEHRLEQLVEELERSAGAISDLDAQGDLFTGRLEDLAEAAGGARDTVARAARKLGEVRREVDDARALELQASDEAAALGARRAALEQLERDREGVEPAVKAVLDLGLPGVVGTLSDFMDADTDVVAAVEAYLGPLARALVVRDEDTLAQVRHWFGESWKGGGGLILLPLDRAPLLPTERLGSLLERVTPHGEGSPWVRALLGQVALVEENSLVPGAGEQVARSGTVADALGTVRIGNPLGATGVLDRRERLGRLTTEHAQAVAVAAEAKRRREEAEQAAREAEEELERARMTLLEAEDAHRRATSEVDARADQRARVERHREELARQAEGTRAARARALERARDARDDRALVLEEEEALHDRRDAARKAAEAVQGEWEAASAEEARLAVEVARAEGELARTAERLDGVLEARDSAHARMAALDAEERQLADELRDARELRARGDQATDELFAERTAAQTELRAREDDLDTVVAALGASEAHVRDARTAERAATEHRHALELERQEVVGRIERIRERLEGEWGRPLERLLEEAEPADGEPEALREELAELVRALDRIGPVNMLAVEEHEEESKRLAFLTEQRDDLVEARNDLRAAIREINRTATELFTETFERIRKNFRETFIRLFEGGEADIWLQDPDDPLESVIEIHASPRGKKTQRIDLLSGGERALTALSLLFGIYLVKPSPFCVLDEIDAPLDESNIGRFIRLLQEFKEQTQFVVMTHNPRTIEAADWIYGVTMEEAGVSTIVGVRLDEALRQASGSAA